MHATSYMLLYCNAVVATHNGLKYIRKEHPYFQKPAFLSKPLGAVLEFLVQKLQGCKKVKRESTKTRASTYKLTFAFVLSPLLSNSFIYCFFFCFSRKNDFQIICNSDLISSNIGFLQNLNLQKLLVNSATLSTKFSLLMKSKIFWRCQTCALRLV